MFGKWGLFVLAALASAAVLTSSAGAVSQGSAGANLSTRAGVVQYLASLGVDARGIVVQRGSHNYAGPNCPGKAWTCTTATRVLQIANGDDSNSRGRDGGGDDHGGGGGGDGDGDGGNHNTFVCASNSGPGSSSGHGDCTIVQLSTSGGDNVARCFEQSRDASATQSCSITQDNNTGDNRIFIVQQVDANNGPTQFASQYGGTSQTNSTGRNDVQISQDIQQSLNKKDTDPSGTQKQDGHQAASVTQQSDTGNNLAIVNQSLALSADAKKGTTLSQLQNTDGDVSSNVGVVQFSGSGRTDARVNQSNEYDAHIGKADTGNQQQGSPGSGVLPGSGENVFYLQNSTGPATIQSNQREDQDLHAEHVTHLTQSQYGPQWMDPEQGSNPNDRYNLSQSSSQHASNPNTQDDQQFAQCTTTGNCTVSEHIQQQNQQQNNSCSGNHCDVGNHFTSGGDGSHGSCNSQNTDGGTCAPSEGTPPPPPPPFRGCQQQIDCSPTTAPTPRN